ncbi:MAG: CoA pyrophosphatase [Planctomycetota bacterium]|nr:MAG: CoA pyrophosphatase [Planctomycetota bacterium]
MNRLLWKSPDLPDLLAADLRTAPDPAWRRDMSPQLSYGRHDGPARGDARRAAVAVVLCWDGREWALPLTVRTPGLTRHAGQVSLPGGLIDAQETPQEAALRELDEELGCRPSFRWLGDLKPLWVFTSNTIVTPCVAAAEYWPAWQPNPREVQQVLKLEVASLLDASVRAPLVIQRGQLQFSAPQLIVEGHSTWGATAVMLGELCGRLMRMMSAPAPPP